MPPRTRLVLRGVLVIVLGLYILLGPGYRQVLGGREKAVRNWVMYSGFARDACAADLWLEGPDGSREVLDRFQVLGGEPWWTQSRSRRRLRRDQLDITVRRVCARLPDPGALRARVRCGTRRSWTTEYTPDAPACRVALERMRARRAR